jgi:hypothetical protein
MTAELNYQSKLNEQYDKVLNGGDVRSFFSHLYLYLQIINTDQVLLELAGRGVSEVHAELYPEDAETMPNLTGGQQPNPFLISSWLSHSLTSDKGQVQLYYCWLRLFLFYSIRKYPLDKRNEYSSQRQYKLNVLIINNEFTNIFKKNTDSGNHLFQQAQYKLCIEVFHSWFMEHLEQTKEIATTNSQDSDEHSDMSGKDITLQLDFDDIHPIVTNLNTGKVYDDFGWLNDGQGPQKLIAWCWINKKDHAVRTNMLRKEKLVGGKGIVDALRGSAFHPDGALSIFAEIVGKPAKITLRSQVQITKQQLDDLLAKRQPLTRN